MIIYDHVRNGVGKASWQTPLNWLLNSSAKLGKYLTWNLESHFGHK